MSSHPFGRKALCIMVHYVHTLGGGREILTRVMCIIIWEGVRDGGIHLKSTVRIRLETGPAHKIYLLLVVQ